MINHPKTSSVKHNRRFHALFLFLIVCLVVFVWQKQGNETDRLATSQTLSNSKKESAAKPSLATPTLPASTLVAKVGGANSPSPASSNSLSGPVVPSGKGKIPAEKFNPDRDYVLVGGHKAHPTRILAKLNRGNEDMQGAAPLQNFALAVTHRYNSAGLILLDSADGMLPQIANEQDSRVWGDALVARIKALQESGLFKYAEPDYIVQANVEPSDAAYADGRLWGLNNAGQNGGLIGADVNAPLAWDITTGSTNVLIAVIDTGVLYSHQDLAAQMWINPDEIAGNGIDDDSNGYIDDVHGINAITGSGDPLDDHGHGTHVSGTIGAAANDGHPHVGVMWNVRLMGCKFLAPSNGGTTSDAIKCIDYAVSKQAKISNNSWGGGGFSQALYDSIAAAQTQGHLFVAAAGNSGQNIDSIPSYPAGYDLDNIVSVAALDRSDNMANFSNYGLQNVDVGAPGVEIFSCWIGSDSSYNTIQGTSMAAPHVTGVAGLILSLFPGSTLVELKQQVMNSAVPIAALTGKCVTGGRVSAFNALNTAPILLPTEKLLSGGNNNGLIDPNECSTLFVVVTNIGLTGATNVQAALTTTNDGVLVVQSASLYPSIPSGGSGTNFTAFQISTAPTFVCGTPIQFALVIKSDEQTKTNVFFLPTGTLGVPLRFDSSTVTNIPDGNPAGVVSALTVSNMTASLGKAVVSFHATHTYVEDLSIKLISPDGTEIPLVQGKGGAGDNYGSGCADGSRTVFDDDALVPIAAGTAPFVGSFKPASPLSVLWAKSSNVVNGVWQLHLADSQLGDRGALQCWSLQLYPATCTDGGGECPGVDLAVKGSVFPEPVVAGSNLVYSIVVTNSGPDTAKNVVMNQTLPSGAVFISAATSQGGSSQSGGILICNLGSIPARSMATITVTVQLTVPGANFSALSVVSSQTDYDLSNNAFTIVSHVTPPASDLSIVMVDSPDPVQVDGLLTYTMTAVNNGPAPADSTVITNFLPGSAAYVSAISSQGSVVNLNNGTLVAYLGTLPSGGTATMTVMVRPRVNEVITARAQISSAKVDPLPGNNTASASTAVTPAADLGISMVGAPDPVVTGSNLTYMITVSNAGPNAATGVVVSDNLAPNVNLILTNASQGTATRAGSIVTWSVGTLAHGANATLRLVVATPTPAPPFGVPVNNSATVSADQADPNSSNNSVAVSTRVQDPIVIGQILPAGATLTTESFTPANGAIDGGETVVMAFRLRNDGNVGPTNLVATLQGTGGVVTNGFSTTNSYGALAAGGLPEARLFTFKIGTNLSNPNFITATLQLQDGLVNLGTASFTFAMPQTVAFSNANNIAIPDYPLLASPYPSTVVVSGVTGLVDNISVVLSNVNHTYPDDLDILLVSPTGRKLLLMSDTGGGNGLVNATLVLNDRASLFLPNEDAFSASGYKPTDYDAGDTFSNAPAAPYDAAFSTFNGVNPNGVWSLYVVDDTAGDAGQIQNGWHLLVTTITPLNQVADLAVSVTASTNTALMGENVTYVFTITNHGPDLATGIGFTNTFSENATLVAATATSPGASPVAISLSGNTLSANLGNLPVGTNAIVTVVVAPNVAGLFTNSASVRGSEVDLNMGNSTTTSIIAVNQPVVDVSLNVDSPHAVTVGSNLTYTLTVTNQGPQTALNVVVTDTLPAGVNFTSAALSQGAVTNSGQTITARFGSLLPGDIAVATFVANAAVIGLKTNVATVVTDSSDTNAFNNAASVITTVNNPAPFVVTAGAVLVSEGLAPANGTIDAGEIVTMNLALANMGSAHATNLTASVQNSGGITALSSSQSYGNLSTGGGAVFRPFTFRANVGVIGNVSVTLQLHSGTNNLGTASYVVNLPQTAANSNSSPISIPSSGTASVYPSVITLSNLSGLISKVSVAISNLSHSFPDDLDMLLVSPAGQKVLLMSDAGGGYSLTNVNLAFDDAAATPVPDATRINSGGYQPTDYQSGETLPPPAPAGVYATSLQAFNGMDANGNWSLYVVDDAMGDAGLIQGGWAISVTTVNPVNPAAELSASIQASAGSIYVGEEVAITIDIANNGPTAAIPVILTNALPVGLEFVSGSASQGSVTALPGLVTANLGQLDAGSSATVMLTLRGVSPGISTNQIAVTSAQTDLNLANNTPRFVLLVQGIPAPQLSALAVADGQFQFTLTGQAGINYIIQASTNLVDWSAIMTNMTTVNGTFKFTDGTSGLPQRYYRALRVP